MEYWMKSSDDDFKAMMHLFEKGDNTWSLFVGHLVLEKLLKAWYIKTNSKSAPLIHDLVRLAEKGNLILDDKQKDILDTISTFNIRGRLMIIKENSITNVPILIQKNGFIISRSSENG